MPNRYASLFYVLVTTGATLVACSGATSASDDPAPLLPIAGAAGKGAIAGSGGIGGASEQQPEGGRLTTSGAPTTGAAGAAAGGVSSHGGAMSTNVGGARAGSSAGLGGSASSAGSSGSLNDAGSGSVAGEAGAAGVGGSYAGEPACVPKTHAELCSDKLCGHVVGACGESADCGCGVNELCANSAVAGAPRRCRYVGIDSCLPSQPNPNGPCADTCGKKPGCEVAYLQCGTLYADDGTPCPLCVSGPPPLPRYNCGPG